MAAQRNFTVRIAGLRNGTPITPGRLDVDEWIKSFAGVRDLLFPEGDRQRPELHLTIKPGSVVLESTTTANAVIQLEALLFEVGRTGSLSIVASKQAKALRSFQQLARRYQYSVCFGEDARPLLRIDPTTELTDADDIWVNADTSSSEAYLDRLIKESTADWKGVEDPEAWLGETRGYED